MIIVPAIMHTGTRFMDQHLLAGVERHVQHVRPGIMQTLTILTQLHGGIAPLRDPEAVAESWKSRDMNPDDLFANFQLLMQLSADTSLKLLAIDAPIGKRNARLAAINASMGLTLATTWPLVPSQGEVPKRALTAVERKRASDFKGDNPIFFEAYR